MIKSPTKSKLTPEDHQHQNKNKKEDHRMDELKNEWLHYLVDPELLRPYEKRIKELAVELETETEEVTETEKLKKSKPVSVQNIAKALLQDSTCDLSIQSLNDTILKRMIVEEGIECLKDPKSKENAIEFIFTREFKN